MRFRRAPRPARTTSRLSRRAPTTSRTAPAAGFEYIYKASSQPCFVWDDPVQRGWSVRVGGRAGVRACVRLACRCASCACTRARAPPTWRICNCRQRVRAHFLKASCHVPVHLRNPHPTPHQPLTVPKARDDGELMLCLVVRTSTKLNYQNY